MFARLIYLFCFLSISWVITAIPPDEISIRPDLAPLLRLTNLTELVSLCYSQPPSSSHVPLAQSALPTSLVSSQPLIHRSSVRPLSESEHQSLSLITTLTAAAHSSSARHQALTQHDLHHSNTSLVTSSRSSDPPLPSPSTCGPLDTEHIPVLSQPHPHAPTTTHHADDSAYASPACRLLSHLLLAPLPWTAEEHHTPPHLITSPTSPSNSPHPHAHTQHPPDTRAAVLHLHRLASESVPLLEQLVGTLRRALGSSSKWGVKQVDKILEKSTRAEILAVKPWHGVEHLRDVLRFKARLKDLDALRKLLNVFLLSGVEVVGFDAYKFLFSKGYGWRPVCIDLRFPSGLLVEFYAVPLDMDVKAVKHGNHLLYEAWRSANATALRRSFQEWRAAPGHAGRWDHDWVRLANARFTSQVRYTNALWRWYRRQGLQSYAEVRRRYLTIVHDVNSCLWAHEDAYRDADGAGVVTAPHSHPLPASSSSSPSPSPAAGRGSTHQHRLGLFKQLVREWVQEESKKPGNSIPVDRDCETCPSTSAPAPASASASAASAAGDVLAAVLQLLADAAAGARGLVPWAVAPRVGASLWVSEAGGLET